MNWQFRSNVLDFSSGIRIMGILNVTPDSFYDRYSKTSAAIDRGLQMVDEGADVIDIGGESSRPPLYGSVLKIDTAEEVRRVKPVITALRRQTSAPLSIDTVKYEVAREALEAGVDIINDISALEDPRMVGLAASSKAPVILMHRYSHLIRNEKREINEEFPDKIVGYLSNKIEYAKAHSVESLAIDPGLGFGKSIDENLLLMRELKRFVDLGYPVLVGASRKSFIWKTLKVSKEEGLEGSLALAVLARISGAKLIRVHDVQSTVRVLQMADAVLTSGCLTRC
jgi:dihydropteroate synthase